MSKKVLVIDDDPDLKKEIEIILRAADVKVFQASSGIAGLKIFYEIQPDLVILDIMMPEMNGFEVCAHLRELADTPILMLTARTGENDMLRGFNLGVNDFVRKPFSVEELNARMCALLRRSGNDGKDHLLSNYYKDSVLEVNLIQETVKLLGNVVPLSSTEFSLLASLVRKCGNIAPQYELTREVWGEYHLKGTSLLSLYIHYLRNKLEDGKHGHQYIRTSWGRGYWFSLRKE